ERLAAREPELTKRRRGFGNLLDFGEREIVAAVELVKVEAGAAQRVTSRGDEEEQRAELARADAVLQDRKIGRGLRHVSLLEHGFSRGTPSAACHAASCRWSG